MTFERRSSKRFCKPLGALLVPLDGSPPVECIMSDISSAGARIKLLRPAEMPLDFELQVPEQEASAQGRLVWSNGKEHGIEFTD